MIRFYCDGCGDEVLSTERVTFKPKPKDRLPPFEIIVGKLDEDDKLTTWNAGHWCNRCLLSAIHRAFAALGIDVTR